MKNLTFFTLLGFIIITNIAQSQKDSFKTKSHKEVNISGKKTLNTKKAGTEIIDKCELGKLACCSLAESFENSTTVDVSYSDGITGGREIQMLGLTGSYSQQLIEGTPYHRGILGKIGLELVPGPWIESIGLNKGMGSVVNGYDNISGQINIEFAKPKKSLDWFLNGYVSEIGKSDLNLIKGFKVADNTYTNILAHTSFSRMTMDNNHDGFSDMPVFTNFNIMNKWHHLAENGFALNTTFQATQSESSAGQILDHEHSNHNTDPYIIEQKTNSYQALVKTGWELDAVKESSVALIYRLNYATQLGKIDIRNIDNNQLYLNVSGIYQSNHSEVNDQIKYKFGFNSLLNHENEMNGNLNFSKKEIVNGIYTEWTLHNELMTAILGLRADYHNTLGVFVSPRATISFNPSEHHSLKITSGFGFKTPTYLTESFGYLISNRQVILPNQLQAERAFNSGAAYRFTYHLFGQESSIEASYFLTIFQNQLILNVETPELLKLEYLQDNSRAQNFQIENETKFSKHLSLKLSYKNDQTIINYSGVKKMIPLLKQDKFLANLYWTAPNNKWRFSTTLLVNGQSRIPMMTNSSETFSPSYPIVHAQINWVPTKKLDFYVGSENIFAYSQTNRIQSFDDVKSSAFDAGMIWGPMDVRRMYVGGKMNF